MPHGLSAPLPQDLQCLLSRLQDEAYQYVTTLCDRANGCMAELPTQTREMSVYTVLCAAVIREVSDYMRLRRLVLLPYIKDLLDKEEDGHDCQACGGGCSLDHSARIREIHNAHQNLRNRLERLNTGGMLVGDAAAYPEDYRTLRANIQLLDNALMDILFVEESALIPMLEDLQHKIRAHG